MYNLEEATFNSNIPFFYNNNLPSLFNNTQNNNIFNEDEFDKSQLYFSKKKLFEIEINFQKKIESNDLLKDCQKDFIRQKRNIKFILEKENLEKFKNNNYNDIYRKDAYYKHFKSIFAKYIKNKANQLKNICFPELSKNNFFAISYKYTGNPKEKDNYSFLSFFIKDLLIYGKNEKIKNRQYNNELLIKYIEEKENISKNKHCYNELKQFLNNTVGSEMRIFYRDKNQFNNIKEDTKCLFYDRYYKKETGISLLEKDGFINILDKVNQK